MYSEGNYVRTFIRPNVLWPNFRYIVGRMPKVLRNLHLLMQCMKHVSFNKIPYITTLFLTVLLLLCMYVYMRRSI
jgi:hypothetical protein